jgi:hypothetical protein
MCAPGKSPIKVQPELLGIVFSGKLHVVYFIGLVMKCNGNALAWVLYWNCWEPKPSRLLLSRQRDRWVYFKPILERNIEDISGMRIYTFPL